jgi:hypothetical protein
LKVSLVDIAITSISDGVLPFPFYIRQGETFGIKIGFSGEPYQGNKKDPSKTFF